MARGFLVIPRPYMDTPTPITVMGDLQEVRPARRAVVAVDTCSVYAERIDNCIDPIAAIAATGHTRFNSNLKVIREMPRCERTDDLIVLKKFNRRVSPQKAAESADRGYRLGNPFALARINQTYLNLSASKPTVTFWLDDAGNWCHLKFLTWDNDARSRDAECRRSYLSSTSPDFWVAYEPA